MASATPQSRDVIFCHQCENEWYRDEHGLACPECHSDFTEIIEAGNDPREDEDRIPADEHAHNDPHTHGHEEFYADDPDEEDINNIQWRQGGPGEPLRGHAHINRPFDLVGEQGGQQTTGAPAGGLMGIFGSLLQNAIGGVAQQQHQQQPGQQLQDQLQQRGGQPPALGSPRGNNNSMTMRTTRHYGGPGYSITVTSSSSGMLLPRNPNGPQPFQNQPDHIHQMLNQMMMNIGALPGGRGGFGALQMGPMGPGGPMFEDMHGNGGFGDPVPFGNLMQLLGGARGGILGDAVLSDEALDQVMTRLMEQHQSGNAPGPASDEAIKALPTKQISGKDLGENGKADCSICMDEVNLGDTVTVLPCSHWFHFDCIRAWLAEHDTCPHCRQGIMPQPAEGEGAPPQSDVNSPQRPRSSQMPGGFPSSGNTERPSSASVFSRMRNTFSGNNSGSNLPSGGAEGGSGNR